MSIETEAKTTDFHSVFSALLCTK